MAAEPRSRRGRIRFLREQICGRSVAHRQALRVALRQIAESVGRSARRRLLDGNRRHIGTQGRSPHAPAFQHPHRRIAARGGTIASPSATGQQRQGDRTKLQAGGHGAGERQGAGGWAGESPRSLSENRLIFRRALPKGVGSRFRHDAGWHYGSFSGRNRLPTPFAASIRSPRPVLRWASRGYYRPDENDRCNGYPRCNAFPGKRRPAPARSPPQTRLSRHNRTDRRG